ncbi:integrase arm-type DNA-binding domain-containing protein [Rhodoblastus sp.]|uniref:tyrosine-type recombinase/integrase n=1 Tax=Rhodoblastus sp. TaxID=1962975 RepID=UPI003144FB59
MIEKQASVACFSSRRVQIGLLVSAEFDGTARLPSKAIPATPLTDLEIKAAKPKDKAYKVSDGGWLYLLIAPTGSKLWRLSYRFAGKQKDLALGVYPDVGIKAARAKRDQAKALLAEGVDPNEKKKQDAHKAAEASANTFDALAAELIEKKRREGKTENTLGKIEWLFSLVRPAIGARPIRDLTSAEILKALKTVEARGRLETAHRLRSYIGEVFRFAIATNRADNDPTSALKGALAAR